MVFFPKNDDLLINKKLFSRQGQQALQVVAKEQHHTAVAQTRQLTIDNQLSTSTSRSTSSDIDILSTSSLPSISVTTASRILDPETGELKASVAQGGLSPNKIKGVRNTIFGRKFQMPYSVFYDNKVRSGGENNVSGDFWSFLEFLSFFFWFFLNT